LARELYIAQSFIKIDKNKGINGHSVGNTKKQEVYDLYELEEKHQQI
jgi:hypothetical protein